jgi:hypothetical protein
VPHGVPESFESKGESKDREEHHLFVPVDHAPAVSGFCRPEERQPEPADAGDSVVRKPLCLRRVVNMACASVTWRDAPE